MTKNTIDPVGVPVRVVVYRWAGQWGPLKVKEPKGECALTVDVVRDVLSKELSGVPIQLEIKDWLTSWSEAVQPLKLKGLRAPIVVVEGEVIAEGEVVNRGVLIEKVMARYVNRFHLMGAQVFGKSECIECARAMDDLKRAGVAFTFRDVIADPGAMVELTARVRRHLPKKVALTAPQVWIDGRYIGGADRVREHLSLRFMPRPTALAA